MHSIHIYAHEMFNNVFDNVAYTLRYFCHYFRFCFRHRHSTAKRRTQTNVSIKCSVTGPGFRADIKHREP